jgi:glycosyltransferase involved in cell wall biosynthesis
MSPDGRRGLKAPARRSLVRDAFLVVVRRGAMALPLVSVILPVHDVARYLDRCLDSLVRQSIGFERIEVIAVDDGSTDGSAEKLDEFAAGRDNVTVIHQPNSGGPGAPRNRGIDTSRGEYLFFVDPDDYLGVEALERMYGLARRNDSDIVLGKMVGVGRRAPNAPFRRHLERADVYRSNAMWSLHSMKLFRRELVLRHGLRFLEGVRLGEDQEFVVGAYLNAATFSVVADYDCYYLVRRDDRQNAVFGPVDPAALYAVVRRVIELVIENTEPGPARNALLVRPFRAEVLGKAANRQFLDWEPTRRLDFVRHAGALVEDYLPDELLDQLPASERLRAYFLRKGMPEELAEVIRFDVSSAPPSPVVRDGRVYGRFPFFDDARYGIPDRYFDITDELRLRSSTERVTWDGDVLRLSWEPGTPLLAGRDVEWSVVLRDRESSEELVVARARAGSAVPEVAISLRELEGIHGPGTRRWDALTRVSLAGVEQRTRIRVQGTLEAAREVVVTGAGPRLVIPYTTSHGYLAVATKPVPTSRPRTSTRSRCTSALWRLTRRPSRGLVAALVRSRLPQ